MEAIPPVHDSKNCMRSGSLPELVWLSSLFTPIDIRDIGKHSKALDFVNTLTLDYGKSRRTPQAVTTYIDSPS